MDREEFKRRMQSLKQFRKDNPDKGYLEWKRLAEGGYPEDPPEVNTDDRTDHPVDKPYIPDRVDLAPALPSMYYDPQAFAQAMAAQGYNGPKFSERIIGPGDRIDVPYDTKYSELTPQQRFMLQHSDVLKKDSQGLKIVSPEFDVLSFVRSIATLPKKFLSSNSAVKDVPANYYRQGKNLIQDARETGLINVRSDLGEKRTVSFLVNGEMTDFDFHKTFDTPFWSKGVRWYGSNPKETIVSIGDNGLEWAPITQHGRITKSLVKAGSRRTPLFKGEVGNTPAELFEFYRKYPIIGNRNVTYGDPHIPITGLNFLYNISTKNKSNNSITPPPPPPQTGNGRRS